MIDILMEEEGFDGLMYMDTEGHYTIGFGTKLPLSKYEGKMLLDYRLDLIKKEVQTCFSELLIEEEAWDILYLMAYQMGVRGVSNFKKMIQALRDDDYVEASVQMLDSKWAKQTPARAKRMSDMMKGIRSV